MQAYGGSYLSVISSSSICYELGVMRFLCNKIAMSDGFEKQILAPTVPSCVHANDLSPGLLLERTNFLLRHGYLYGHFGPSHLHYKFACTCMEDQ